MQRKIRTRYAPSPTGFQHIGGVRTALYCYLFAKKHGGDFILRIEDTDQTRYVAEAEQYIIDSLNWLGIQCDEGVHVGGNCAPYRQSERKSMYRQYADRLVENGYAYYAFDTAEALDQMRQQSPNFQYNAATRATMNNQFSVDSPTMQQHIEAGDYVIRFKMPADEKVTFTDMVRGTVTFETNELDDKVLMKSDGMPTYHLANVVDDYTMQITHVIRGEEWLSSTPLHVLLYRGLGISDIMPVFAHLPLMLSPDGKGKLSKRAGDRYGFPVYPLAWKNAQTGESSNGFREMGFFANAFVNILAFFGWHPQGEREIFSMDELIAEFDMSHVSKHGARFDFDKAKWFNQQYLRQKDTATLAELALQVAPAGLEDTAPEFLTKVIDLVKDRLTFVSDVWTEAAYLFNAPTKYDDAAVQKRWKAELQPVFDGLVEHLAAQNLTTAGEWEAATKAFATENGAKIGEIMPLFRLALTGSMAGPCVFEMATVLGKRDTLERLIAFAKYAIMLTVK